MTAVGRMALVRTYRFGRLVHARKEQDIILDTVMMECKRPVKEEDGQPTVTKRYRLSRTAATKARPILEKSPLLNSLSDLQLASVKPGTAELYVGLWTEVITFAKKRRPPITEGAVDHLLTALMSDSYLEGYQLGRGSQMIAAAKLFFPVPSRVGQRKTTRAAQALRGWRAKAPGLTRLPLPSHTNGKLVLHPHKAEQPSKTQQFDEVVTIDLKMYKELRNHGLDVLKSVRGYRKEGRASQQLSGLPVETRARAIAAPRLLKPALNKL